MCYPTSAFIANLAEQVANENDLKPDSQIKIWDNGDIQIYLYRNGWNYAARLRCDNIVSAMPVIECHANKWRKTATSINDMAAWLFIVAQRRYERRQEMEQLNIIGDNNE